MESGSTYTYSSILKHENKTGILMDICKSESISFVIHLQMVPLIKKSSDMLVVKVGEYAKSGNCVELVR